MSYEKGDKFVLEIAEIFEGGEKELYRMKGFASLVFDENGLQRLRRISETSEEAYMRGYLDGKSATERKRVEHPVVEPSEEQLAKARAEGAEEAWEFRNTVAYSKASDESKWYMGSSKIFFCKMTYAEAKADFEKWKSEQKKPWEPNVGDVVRMKGNGPVGIVNSVMKEDGEMSLWVLGSVATNYHARNVSPDDFEPTGRHFDLTNVLKVLEEVEHE